MCFVIRVNLHVVIENYSYYMFHYFIGFVQIGVEQTRLSEDQIITLVYKLSNEKLKMKHTRGMQCCTKQPNQRSKVEWACKTCEKGSQYTRQEQQ